MGAKAPEMAPGKAGQAPRGSDRAGQADRIFVNGRVWTGEPGRPLVEALAVRGKTVVAVGTSADIRKLSGKGTDVVDLRGRFAAPGFIDGHLHLLGGSLSLEELRLDEAFTFGALAERVKSWAAAHPDAHWVTGRGWTYAAFPGGLPSPLQLDALVPGRPAYLVSYDGHTGWANSAALRIASVTRETKDPPGGEIVRDAKGEPTGVLKENAHGPRRAAGAEAAAPREGARAAQGDRPGRGLGPHHRPPGGDRRARARAAGEGPGGRPAAARLRGPRHGARPDPRGARPPGGAPPPPRVGPAAAWGR